MSAALQSAGRPSDCLSVEATVCAVRGDGSVELEFKETPRCAGCAGSCTWSRPRASERARFTCSLPLEPGDIVRVSLPASHILGSALLLHGLPWASLLGGALVGTAIAQSDLGTLLGALTGVVLALAATRSLRRRAESLTLARTRLERLP